MIKLREKGFTLVEIMIVVAIIAILSAIAIPNFMASKVKIKSECLQGEYAPDRQRAGAVCYGCVQDQRRWGLNGQYSADLH